MTGKSYTQAEFDAAQAECEREPVHIPGAIQPFGALLCLDPSLERVRQVSTNIESWLGVSVAQCLGTSAAELLGERLHKRLARELRGRETLPGALGARLNGRRVYLSAYRSTGAVVVEIEALREAVPRRWLARVNDWLGRLAQAQTQEVLLSRLAESVRDVTGYDRTLVYRFDEVWNGQVIAENRNDRLGTLLHHHFPAADIPSQVRDMYARNRLRMIVDGEGEPVALEPALEPTSGQPLDLGPGALRAVAPIHREYMHNMGTRASLSIAIFSDAGLWGLVSCHSCQPVALSPVARDSIDTLVRVAGQRLFLLQARAEAHYRQAIHEKRVALTQDAPSSEGPGELLTSHADDWLTLFDAVGLALVYRDQVTRLGCVPPDEPLRELMQWLSGQVSGAAPWSTQSLSDAGYPGAGELRCGCCGLLAMPVMYDVHAPGWLLLFRREKLQVVDWAGRPDKSPERSDGRLRLSPRESFSIWRERVAGKCRAWLASEEVAARDLGDDLAVLASAHEIASLNERLEQERHALAQANAHLEKLASTDSLTGAMNRYRIEHQVQMALANAERYDRGFCLLLFDIDRFKQVNDDYGHEEGDRILKTMVRVLESGLREGDELGRWGGEEFLVLVPAAADTEAMAFAERLRAQVEDTEFGLSAPITISIGVARWRPGDSIKSLVVRADRAMYRAKECGRNRVCFDRD